MIKRWNKFFYRNSKIGADPDSSWKLQNEQRITNEVYQLMYFSGEGKLSKVYDEGGPHESYEDKKARIWKFAEEEIKPNFLNDRVQLVSEKEYKQYISMESKHSKHYLQHKEKGFEFSRGHSDMSGNVNVSSVSIDSVLSQYSDENCYWRLDKRGGVGETALHLLFVNDTPKCLAIAKMLLELYPGLAADSYMGIDYFGETCLHFAIINNSMESLKILLKTGHCNVHARARGKFFLPVDYKLGGELLERDKYEGLAYYGEYPLSFAASVGNNDMYDELLKHGADHTKQDTFGNTALHLTVIHNQVDLYHHAVSHPYSKSDPSVKNKEGLTPMALAAKLGRDDMFRAIIDISAVKFWSYSRMICNAYPLKYLDSIAPSGETNWDSGLMQLIKGDEDSHLDMLEGGVVTSLLNQKWKTFARSKYIRLFVSHIFHIIFLSCSVYLRPNDISTLLGGTDPASIARYVFEILTCIGCASALYFAIREIVIETFIGFLLNMRTVPSRFLYYLGCVLILLCIPFRIAKLVDPEDWLLLFAIPFLWSYFLFFARGLSMTGPFVTMIYTMIVTDILIFSIIYSIILLTSGVVFFYLFNDLQVTAFLTELGTFMTLFQMSLGEFDYEAVRSSRYPAFSIILFVIYMLMMHILLLSMLIAMMTRTYERIASKNKKEWRRQWASIVMILERSYSYQEKLDFQRKYSVKMHVTRMTSEGPTDPTAQQNTEVEDRGLLWIHDRGVGSGERKAAIASLWQKSKEIVKKEPNENQIPPKKPISKRLVPQNNKQSGSNTTHQHNIDESTIRHSNASDDEIPSTSVMARRRWDAKLAMRDDECT